MKLNRNLIGSHAIKNWWGRDAHPTDDLVHWSERKKDDVADLLRVAYDKIAEAGLLDELDLLLDATYTEAQLTHAEDEAGESI